MLVVQHVIGLFDFLQLTFRRLLSGCSFFLSAAGMSPQRQRGRLHISRKAQAMWQPFLHNLKLSLVYVDLPSLVLFVLACNSATFALYCLLVPVSNLKARAIVFVCCWIVFIFHDDV
jgi:hypothetical protein